MKENAYMFSRQDNSSANIIILNFKINESFERNLFTFLVKYFSLYQTIIIFN